MDYHRLGLWQYHGTRDSGVESGKLKPMALGKQKEMGISGAGGEATPVLPPRCPEIVWKALRKLPKGF